MIFQHTSLFRVFNARGVESKGKVYFLSNLLTKIDNLLKIFKLIKNKNYMIFYFNKFLKYLLFFCVRKNKRYLIFLEPKDFFILLCQTLWRYILDKILEKNNIYDFFLKTFKKKQNPLLSFLRKYKKNFQNKVCKSVLIKSKKAKSSITFLYSKAKKLIKTLYRSSKDRHNISIFVNTEKFGSFRGSITPFGENKISIIASTGLKGDVEMDEIDLWDNQVNDDKFPNFAAGSDHNAIFKVKNFKNKIYTKFKRKRRHLFYYNAHNLLGLQRFCSESLFSFFVPQELKRRKSYFLFSERESLFSRKPKFSLKINLRINLRKQLFGYHFKKIKITGLSFFLLKSLLKLYRSLKKRGFKLFNYISYFYRSISFLPKIKVVCQKVFKSFKETTLIKTILLKKKKNFFFFNKNETYFYKNIFQNKNYTKTLIKQVSISKYLNYFLRSFLNRQQFDVIKLLIKEEKDERQPNFNLINFNEKKISFKPYWFETYKIAYWNFYFLFDLLFTLKLVLVQQKKDILDKKHLLALLEGIYSPFEKLKEQWNDKSFLHLKESGKFFKHFLTNIFLNTYLFFNIHIKKYEKTPLNFIICNLYIHMEKGNYKKKKRNFLIRSTLLKGSSFFLSKWFYYRQINKFSDECSLNSNYLLERPPETLNLSYKESYFYNLNKINSVGTLTLIKLNNFLDRTKNLNLKSLFNIRKTRVKDQLKYGMKKNVSGKWTAEANWKLNSRLNIFNQANNLNKKEFLNNIMKYRHFIWGRKFSIKRNILEKGFNFKLPSILRKRNFFWLKKRIKENYLVSPFIKWHYFRQAFLDYYKNYFEIKEENNGELIYSTFFCIFNSKNEKDLSTELNFWFVK